MPGTRRSSAGAPTGPGVRIDSGVEQGDVISGNFDSMLSKLIVTGATRPQALQRARRALEEMVVEGIPTVIPFDLAVVTNPDFAPAEGPFKVHTRWIETDFADSISIPADPGFSTTAPDGERRTITVEVDGRPLSSWGCDGVIVSTPTGSTAYAFSAGGPVVWPQVEAMLLVPSAAHALFARPLVLGPDTHLAVEIKAATEGAGVMWCDGRRHVDLPPGARIEVCRGVRPLRLARLTSAPFTDRLVAKFNLSVAGWRGNGDGVAAVSDVDDVDVSEGARP